MCELGPVQVLLRAQPRERAVGLAVRGDLPVPAAQRCQRARRAPRPNWVASNTAPAALVCERKGPGVDRAWGSAERNSPAAEAQEAPEEVP